MKPNWPARKASGLKRGGGGCQHYREEDRVAKYIVPRKPDLVYIGGISQRNVESIREVIRQLRTALPDVDILLATGTFGTNILVNTDGTTMPQTNPAASPGYSFVIVWGGIDVKGLPLAPNIDEMESAVRLALQYGFDYVSFKPCLVRLEGSKRESLLNETAEEALGPPVE